MPQTTHRRTAPRAAVKWTTGDFTIITSDDVKLKIEAYYLFAASVFRDASSLARDGQRWIEMTDPVLETTTVVTLFLEIVKTGAVPVPDLFTDTNIVQACRLAMLLRKFDCQALLGNLKIWAELQVRLSTSADIGVFALGASVDDVDLCRKPMTILIIEEVSGSDLWKRVYPGITPGDITPTVWGILPPQYLWALVSATAQAGYRNGQKQARRFKDTIKKYHVST